MRKYELVVPDNQLNARLVVSQSDCRPYEPENKQQQMNMKSFSSSFAESKTSQYFVESPDQ